jgi:ubiquinone/menaquinone biosynthesis C-methylase UbiE
VAFKWLEGSVVAMPLPDADFDVVLCQQGLQFFSGPTGGAALDESYVFVQAGHSGGQRERIAADPETCGLTFTVVQAWGRAPAT